MRTSLPRADINVTPMIDVMLVLLIIFMVVVPVIAAVVNLPIAQNPASRPEEPGQITLLIKGSGAFVLESGGVDSTRWDAARLNSADDLHDRLATLYMNRTRDRILYLKADSALEFSVVERAMGIARKAGVRVVAAVAERRVSPGM